jgi:hypothetical protein
VAASTSLTPRQRSLRARRAALIRWSLDDPTELAAKGQAGLLRKFYDQTDPALPEAERQRRAEAARRAHMTGLAFKSSKARRKRAARPDTRDAA